MSQSSRRRNCWIFALLLAGASRSAGAEGLGVGVKGGTTGLGVELTKSLGETVNVRLGFNTFTIDYDGDESDIEYQFRAELQSLAGLIDWHPNAGAFRLSVGGIRNGTSLKGTGSPVGVYTVGDTRYSQNQIGELNLRVDVPTFAPYAGLGFGNASRGGRLFLSLDLGVIFQGSPEAKLTATGPVAETPQFRDDAQAEVAELNADLRRYRYYPVLAIGIGVRF
jgi:hypothetical protein